MTLEQNTAHVAEGQALPIYDLRQSLQQALLASYLVQVQELEDAVWSLYFGTMVEHATGDALDQLGEIVGQPRQGRSDEVYRVWILARSLVSRSNGKPEELLAILRMVCDESIAIVLSEIKPARIHVRLAGTVSAELASQVGELMLLAKAQGIAVDLTFAGLPTTSLFTLGTSSDYAHADPNTGLADTALTTGGRLTSIV
jgi:hypothetical protein